MHGAKYSVWTILTNLHDHNLRLPPVIFFPLVSDYQYSGRMNAIWNALEISWIPRASLTLQSTPSNNNSYFMRFCFGSRDSLCNVRSLYKGISYTVQELAAESRHACAVKPMWWMRYTAVLGLVICKPCTRCKQLSLCSVNALLPFYNVEIY